MSLSATHRALLATSLVLGLTACAGHGVRTHGTNAPPAVTVTVERGDRTFSTAAGVRLRDDLVATSSRSVDRVPEWSGLWVTGEALRARASTWVAGHRGGIDLALLKVFVEPGTAPLMNDTPVCTTSPSRLVVSVPDQKPPFPAEVDGESLQVNAPASTRDADLTGAPVWDPDTGCVAGVLGERQASDHYAWATNEQITLLLERLPKQEQQANLTLQGANP